MADNSNGGGATPFLAFLVGGVVVTAAVLGFLVFEGHSGSQAVPPSHISLNVKAPETRR